MKTVIILYMPGHAGNFMARLFSLNPETMPLIRHDLMDHHIGHGTSLPDPFDRLTNYQFSQAKQEFGQWQKFHQAYADFSNNSQYRLLNLFCGLRYSRIVIPVHPCEFVSQFVLTDDCEFYYVDLDLDRWGQWIQDQQQKLKFYNRENEPEKFDRCKKLYNMKPINLTKMLESETSFIQEYLAICSQMLITPLLDQALWLRQDWYSVRVQG